jgi:WD40 repeat protein
MLNRSLAVLLALAAACAVVAQEKETLLPPADTEPMLRLEAGGPTTTVNSLTFSPDGETLYAAGFDKVVRTWTLEKKTKQFVLDKPSYRVPIGAGLDGAINAIALSSDGIWLAAAGTSVVRGGPGGRGPGLVVSKVGGMTPSMWRDQGVIFVFNTTKPADVRVLRGHRGPVVSMTFVPSRRGKPPVLVSAAREWDGEKYGGFVRVWDVEKASEVRDGDAESKAQLAVLKNLPDPFVKDTLINPGLAVWSTGENAKDVRLVSAFGDGKIRIWDVGDNEEVAFADSGRFNIAIAALPESKVVTGSLVKTDGVIQVWELLKGAYKVTRWFRIPMPHENVALLPRSITPFSSKPGGPVDHVAVLLRAIAGEIPGQDNPNRKHNGECYLQIIDLNNDKERPAREPMLLWKDTQLPVVSAAWGGSYLAVAGDPDHEVRVYGITDLLAGKNIFQPPLRSVGVAQRYVSFVTRDKELGLLFNEQSEAAGSARRDAKKGDVVFDFEKRELLDPKGYTISAPKVDGWTVSVSPAEAEEGKPAKPAAVVVKQDGKEIRRIALRSAEIPDDYAVLPGKPSLLAMALREAGEPRLYLYNLDTGDLLRQYTWHTDRIRSIAFSPDGRLLTSVADDQMICVWSLAHLDKILGVHGALKGVGIKAGAKDGDRATPPIIAAVDATSPARGKLEIDDVVDGIVVGKDKVLKPLATPRAFYEAIADLKPGSEVTLRVHAPGGNARDVVLPVGQGTDERKPLLTLFVTRDAGGGREWVGWNPYGPYEASARKAERHIGWHFNTGKANAPASFALAEEYRKGRYREGILRQLLAKGSLAPALEAWEKENKAKPAPRPNLDLELESSTGPLAPNGRGVIIVRQAPKTLELRIDGGFPDDRVAGLNWQLDNGAVAPLRAVAGHWEADLSAVKWARQDYKLKVTLRTDEADPKEYTREVTVRFQPTPVLNFAPEWQKKFFGDAPPQRVLVRDGPKWPVEATVEPGVSGGKVKVTLRQGDKEPQVLDVRDGKVKTEVDLQEGDNRIEISAVGEDVPKEMQENETTRRILVATYAPEKAKVGAPLISLSEVDALTGDLKTIPVELGKPLIVESKTVRIRGRVVAEEALTEALHGKDALARFKPGTKTTEILEDLVLEPGRNEVKFSARTKNSPEATASLTLDYRPPLPQIVWMTPNATFYDGEQERTVPLSARLIDASDGVKYTVELLHDGKVVPDTLKVEKQKVTGIVRLANGDNRFRLKVTAGEVSALSDELMLRYARPPKITFDQPEPPKKPLTDLTATVTTASDLLPESVQATINGKPLAAAEVAVVEKGDEVQKWRVRFKDVPLIVGDNEVSLSVANREATARKPGELKLTFKPAAVSPRPEVKILEPGSENLNVTRPDLTIRFVVKSAGGLRRVELVRDGANPVRQGFDLSKLKADGPIELKIKATLQAQRPDTRKDIDPTSGKLDADGYYEVAVPLALDPKENRLRVEAVSEGGGTSDSVVVSYVPRPVRIVFDEIQEPTGKPIPAKALTGGKVQFDRVEGAFVVVRGRLTWDEEKDEQMKGVKRVRVFVNGFQQPPAELYVASDAAPRERRFEGRLVLNRQRSNLVEVDLPDNSQEVNNRPSFVLDCDKALSDQRLHLLVVSLTEEDEQTLTKKALQAFQTPAFSEVQTYLLTGDVTPEAVFGRLAAIRRTVARRVSEGATNDVVMIYYNGVESVGGPGHYFKSNRPDPDLKDSGISCQGLADFFPEILGAQLLVLDVTREKQTGGDKKDRVSAWPPEVRTGIFRSAWLDEKKAAPADSRVMTAWGATAPKANRLQEIETGVEDLILQQYRNQSAMLAYDKNVPACLEGLPIGRNR